MQEFWVLNIEDGTSIDSNFIGWFSCTCELPMNVEGLTDYWWRKYNIDTKEEYRKAVLGYDGEINEEYMSTLPDEKIFFRNHDDLLLEFDALKKHLIENKRILDEWDEDWDPEIEDKKGLSLRNPKVLEKIFSEVHIFQEALWKAKEENKGFHLLVWLDN
ncbi:MAG TPA: hypothetical protein VL651_07760 [Bacteroidia bacterium]|jgi:hypothetical protein|nr:hypothetical protein [Bacteroidia bacterium]